jgi:hypothetical protein
LSIVVPVRAHDFENQQVVMVSAASSRGRLHDAAAPPTVLGEFQCDNILPPASFCCWWPVADKAKDLYDTAQLQEKQNNRPYAKKIYRQIVEEHPNSP